MANIDFLNEKDPIKKFKVSIILYLMGLIFFIIGYYIIWTQYSWKLAAGIFLVQLANNIQLRQNEKNKNS